MSTFGDLRSLLQQPPSPEVWLALVRLLEAADPTAREDQLYPYAEGALRGWPEVLRVIEPQRLDALPEAPEAVHPSVRLGRALTRALDADGMMLFLRVASSPWLERLSVLDLRVLYGSTVHARHVAAWQDPEVLPGLRWLRVQDHGVWHEEARTRWLDAPWVSRVEALHLDYVALVPDDVECLCHAGRPEALRVLSARFAETLGDASAALLASSPHLANLEYLELDSTGMGNVGLAALVGAEAQLPALTHLLVPRQDDVNASGLRHAFKLTGMSRFEALDLCSLNVTDANARLLAAQTHLGRLRHLDLERNKIGDAGALALASSPHMPALERLLLAGNRISSAGWQAARQAPHGARVWDRDIPLQLPPPEGMRRFLEGIADAAPEAAPQQG